MSRDSILSIITVALSSLMCLADASAQSTFQPVWRTAPWDSGGLHPSSVVWSMLQSELDLDNDGKKEFLVSTAWSGTFYNMVYLYERSANNSFQNIWSYSFYPYSNDYSAVAVGDLDQDGRKEILCLVDPADSTYHGFYVFEWDGTDNGFPSVPTATWNLNLPGGFDEGTAIIAGDFDNDGRDEVAVTLVERWSVPKSRFMIFSLDPGSTFQNPTWTIEYQDSTTFPVIGYSLASTDLDHDGKKEIVVSGWDWLNLAFYENTGLPNSYVLATHTAYVDTTIDFSNMGFLEANFDNNATNELYIATALGKIYVMTNPGDISLIGPSNFFLLHQYDRSRGIGGVSKGDIDGNGVPEMYLAGSYHEGVFQWKYTGGDVTPSSSYQKNMIFQDDTTDNHTPGSDQGWFRPAKVVAGDFDSDGTPDVVIASASFARDKPILMVVEQTTTGVTEEREQPIRFALKQNYPNPFNPATTIEFSLPSRQNVRLSVVDLEGKEVSVLVNDELSAGAYKLTWEAVGFASGVYFCRLTTNGISQVREMALVR
jgi:hypothetical protein